MTDTEVELTSIDWSALGTWVVGGVGAAIALMQYRNSIFIPHAEAITPKATSDLPGRRRVLVRIMNHGGAAGMVDDVYAVDDGEQPLADQAMSWVGWERRPPVPFVLPGRAVATLLVEFDETLPPNAAVAVQFGGHGERCAGLVEVPFLPSTRTSLPPDSLGITEPPADPSTGS